MLVARANGGLSFMSMKIEDVGAAVRARRRQLGVSQRDLAEIAGVSEHTVSDLESGKANPTWVVLTDVLTPLGLELTVRLRTVSR